MLLLTPGIWIDMYTKQRIEVFDNHVNCMNIPQPWNRYYYFTEGDGVVFLNGAVGKKYDNFPPTIVWNGTFIAEWQYVIKHD